DVDEAYLERLATLIVDPKVVRAAKSLRIVFTPLHGTGSVTIKPLLKRLGFNFEVVAEQDRFDPRFSTVKSPNPENAEALQMVIAEHYGLRCVETLTGFKYFGAKLEKYEQALPENVRQKDVDLSEEETQRLRLAHAAFYDCGGEESYG